MSKLVTVLYEVADIRAEYERARKDLGGPGMGRLIWPLAPGNRRGRGHRDAEYIGLLAERLRVAREMLEQLDADDLSIRRGREIRDALRNDIDALARCHTALSRLREGAEGDASSGTHEVRRTALRIAYDDAWQQQRRIGARLNRLIETL